MILETILKDFSLTIKAFVCPGQGWQYVDMGRELFDSFLEAKELFEQAKEYFGRRLFDVMFFSNEAELMKIENMQLAVFVYKIVAATVQKSIVPDIVAGHSLGEFSVLAINGTINFEDGLNLVLKRATIAQNVKSINGYGP